RLPTLPQVGVNTTPENLQDYVHNAAADGGWVIFVMHHICDAPSVCDNLSMSSGMLSDFLDWLVSQRSAGVVVKTVGQVVDGDQAPQPAVAPPPATPPGPDGVLLQNGSLENITGPEGVPDCWQTGGEGDNKYIIENVADAHDGQSAMRIEITELTNGARRV